MKALTLWQPWAAHVFVSGKDVENRSWAPPATMHGHPLLIHAGTRVDHSAPMMGTRRDRGKSSALAGVRGAILGVVTLVDAHESSSCQVKRGDAWGHCSRWARLDSWHWLLTEPRLIEVAPDPIFDGTVDVRDHGLSSFVAVRGRQSLWTPPRDVQRWLQQYVPTNRWED